jgi:glyoxylate reductase
MAGRPQVAVTRIIPDAGLDLLREAADIRLWEQELPPSPEELDALLDGADGALTLLTDRIDGPVLDRHPGLKVVSNFAVGFDNVDVPAATERGVAVCNTPTVLNEATAEMAFTLLVSAARRVVEAVDYVRDGNWKTWGPTLLMGQGLTGATLGIVGFGRIGKMLARMVSGFGMEILVHDVYYDASAEEEFGVRYVSLAELLEKADFVSLHVLLNDETRHMIGADQFAQMKPTAVLINAARGPVVDTDALVEALKAGQIFAAGLDVTDPEPLPADHPLVQLPNCIVVPHIASATVKSRNDMATLAASNLLDVLEGREPRAIVNPDVLRRTV